MPLEIVLVEPNTHQQEIRQLFEEHLSFLHSLVGREFDTTFDIKASVEQNMNELDQFMPPQGRVLIAYADTELAGGVCLRRISEDIGEVKRMFVRPQHRRKGIGRALVEAVITAARAEQCTHLRLDTLPVMSEAVQLYRSLGFTLIPPYAESEIPEQWRPQCIFMELYLGKPDRVRGQPSQFD